MSIFDARDISEFMRRRQLAMEVEPTRYAWITVRVATAFALLKIEGGTMEVAGAVYGTTLLRAEGMVGRWVPSIDGRNIGTGYGTPDDARRRVEIALGLSPVPLDGV